MQYEEFIERVQQRGGLTSFAEAEAATQATLATLGEYLTEGEGPDLGAQLPQGLGEQLQQQPPERSKIFSYNDFIQLVGDNEEVGFDKAEDHARAVMGVLEEAVTEGEMQDVRRQFSSEFDPLFRK